MNLKEILTKADEILKESKAAVLATIDEESQPHMRWMNPVVDVAEGIVYAVTNPNSKKAVSIGNGSNVEWMFQTKLLDRIVNLRGRVNIIENPSLKSEIMERLAKRLNVFWKVNNEETDFVVLETMISEGLYLESMKGNYEFAKR